MKNRFKAIIGALALTFMLLFSAAAFARTTNTSIGNPNMSSGARRRRVTNAGTGAVIAAIVAIVTVAWLTKEIESWVA